MSKLSPVRIRGLITFSLVVFWPVVLFFLIIWLPGIVLNIFISLLSKTSGSHSLESFVEGGLFLLIPFLLILASYNRCLRASWKKRGWIIYGTWLLLAILMGFLVSAALGGVSMAVVEGVAGPVLYRYMQYMGMALIIALFSNIVVIPWVFLSIFFLKKIGEEKVFS